MDRVIGQRELRNDNAEIMRRVEAGESFTVTRNGRPIADLIPDLADVDLGAHESAEPAVSAVSLAELAYGLDVDDPIERQARAERYHAVRDQFAVLSFVSRSAEIYGTMAAVIRRAGRNPRPRRMDLQIAATAAAHSLPLLTRNLSGLASLERLLKVVVI